jgi:hypothetical protein
MKKQYFIEYIDKGERKFFKSKDPFKSFARFNYVLRNCFVLKYQVKEKE